MDEQVVEIPGLQTDLTYTGKKYAPGSIRQFHIYLPPEAAELEKDGLAVYVLLEHTPSVMCPIVLGLMKEGIMPYGIVLFLYSGILQPTLPDGEPRGLRTEEFDENSRTFSDFIVEEMIPEAVRLTGAKIHPSPDMHFITGGSSGGILAWYACWFRNDYFRRSFLSSPTFAAERGGEEVLTIVRKSEARPIRMYMTSGSEEPDGVDGSSLYASLNAASTFEFSGYDFRFEMFNGEGHCCRRQDAHLWRRMQSFVWANWRTDPVKTLGNQFRISQLFNPCTTWELFQGKMPPQKAQRTKNGTYTFDGGSIYLKNKGIKTEVASGFGHISSITLSVDRWRLYIADTQSRYLFAMSVNPDGTLTQLYKFAPLYLAYDCHVIGANSITIIPSNRVFAATELGVQGVWVTGMIDMILPLPGDLPVDAVGYSDNWLYASSGDLVFRRSLRQDGPVRDGIAGGGSRSHLIP